MSSSPLGLSANISMASISFRRIFLKCSSSFIYFAKSIHLLIKGRCVFSVALEKIHKVSKSRRHSSANGILSAGFLVDKLYIFLLGIMTLSVKSKYSTNNFKKIRIPQVSETRFGSFVGLFFVLMFISSSLAVRCQTTAWRLKVYGLTFIFRPQGPVQRFLLRVPLPSSSRFESGGR